MHFIMYFLVRGHSFGGHFGRKTSFRYFFWIEYVFIEFLDLENPLDHSLHIKIWYIVTRPWFLGRQRRPFCWRPFWLKRSLCTKFHLTYYVPWGVLYPKPTSKLGALEKPTGLMAISWTIYSLGCWYRFQLYLVQMANL